MDEFSSVSAAGDVSAGMKRTPNFVMDRFRDFSAKQQGNNMPDDLGPNKAHLFCTSATANPGDVLVDLGVRLGASSFTMLEATAGQRCQVIGVDPSPCPFICPDRYEYIQTDSITAADAIPNELFMTFFDTLHIKEQVMAELHHYWPKIRVGGWAVFHDTEWESWRHDTYLGITWDHVIEGVNAFFANAGKRVTVVHYPESHGMTFVRKNELFMPEVPGMELALAASKRLTEALCR